MALRRNAVPDKVKAKRDKIERVVKETGNVGAVAAGTILATTLKGTAGYSLSLFKSLIPWGAGFAVRTLIHGIVTGIVNSVSKRGYSNINDDVDDIDQDINGKQNYSAMSKIRDVIYDVARLGATFVSVAWLHGLARNGLNAVGADIQPGSRGDKALLMSITAAANTGTRFAAKGVGTLLNKLGLCCGKKARQHEEQRILPTQGQGSAPSSGGKQALNR